LAKLTCNFHLVNWTPDAETELGSYLTKAKAVKARAEMGGNITHVGIRYKDEWVLDPRPSDVNLGDRPILACGDDGITVSLGQHQMVIDRLDIGPASNWKCPHELRGRGGAQMKLTSEQAARVTAEYMRYTFFKDEGAPKSYAQKSAGFEFSVSSR